MKWIRLSATTLTAIIAMNAVAQWQPPGATGGSIYYNEGNVGIGNPTPGEKLDVTGNVIVTGTLRLGTQLLGLPWKNTANVYTTDGYVKLVTPIVHNESNMFTIKIAGYSYMPTAEPVDIRCSGYAHGGSTLIRHSCSTVGFSLPVEITTETRPNASAPVVVIRLGTPSTPWYYSYFTAEYIGWTAKSAADFLWVSGETVPAPGLNMNNVVEGDKSGTLLIKAPDGVTTTTRLTVEGAGAFSGRVGVGTPSPLAPLHVNGPVSQSQLYVTNNTLNTGVLSALSNAADNVSLGFDVDYSGGSWKARAPTIASLYKSGGHFKLVGSGNNTINGTPVFNVYQDVDLTTGASVFRVPSVPTVLDHTTTITGGTIQLGGFPTQIRFGNGQFIKDNSFANMHIYAGNNLTVDTNAGGDITMVPGSQNFRVTGNVIASNTATIGPLGGAQGISRLTVHGSAHFNGTVTGTNIKAKYQDVAEWVPSVTSLTPATVVVLDAARSNHVTPSLRPYDSSVAGVVSAQPGIILGEEGASKSLIATTGRVLVRVDASRHPIAIGDLLVTSDKPGLAMKSIPIDLQGIAIHRPGTVVGKALEPLAGGEGQILVLLSLQ